MSSHRLFSAAVLVAAAVGWGGIATADVSKGVIAAFRGELVVTKGDLPEGKTEKDTIVKIKAERIKELTGDAKGSTTGWQFHYTAFLTKTGATKLTLEFYTSDKKLVANNQLEGVDPKLTVLSGDISIDEDDGLTKGKAYTLKLVTDKNAVVASTPLVMK
jgi:hypothetical protein